jgi:hypothetical protein
MATRRGKIVFGVGVALFGALTFLAASAFVVSRDQPKWLAAIAGALAFPVLPAVWHVLGERKRKQRIAAAVDRRSGTPKSTLASSDRYLMRAIAVALVVIGPMVAIGGFGFVRGVWTHKAWFIPRYELAVADDLLAHVPADAEAVITIRDLSAKEKGAGLLAWGDRQLLVIAKGADLDNEEDAAEKLAELNKNRSKIPFITVDPVALVPTPRNMLAAASERWRSQIEAGAGPSAELRAELARAPSNAALVLGIAPRTSAIPIKSAAAWLVGSDEKLVLDGRIEATDPVAAEKLLDYLRTAWKVQATQIPAKCRDEVELIAGQIKTARTAAIITIHLELQPEKLAGLMFCAMADK